MNRVFLCNASDIKVNTAKQVLLANGRSIALFHTGSGFFAVENRCPHAGAPLHEGIIEEDTIMCIWHGWKFNLKDGSCLTKRYAKLKGFPLEVYNDRVYLLNSTEIQNPE